MGIFVDRIGGEVYLFDIQKSNSSGGTSIGNLQQVTQLGAVTTIESTFKSGIVTNRIRPTGDTISALNVTKADGITSVISIDTISGFTGFGTEASQGLIHAYGIDNSGDPSVSFQPNSIIVDGVVDGDKNIAWYDNGVPKWFGQTYRSEDAEFWYLYNNEADNDLLTGSRGGLFAINKATNILNSNPAQIIGMGLNDLVVRGLYTQDYNTVYQIKINSTTGLTDTYVWRKSVDNGFTYSPYSSVSAVTTTQVELEYGVLLSFLNLTGHTTGDMFQFIGIAQLPTASLSISPYSVNEILISNDYNSFVYRDVTGNLNGGVDIPNVTIFPTGTTNAAILLGFLIPIHTVNFELESFGVGLSLVVEYFNPVISAWTGINFFNNNYVDGTNNFTNNGKISWSTTNFINWNLAPLSAVTKTQTPTYYSQFYWIRIRTASPATISPVLLNISVGTDKRFSVFATNQDLRPKLYVDSLGRINIGGGNITGKNVLQINSSKVNLPNSIVATNSLVEIDSEDSSVIDFKLKLASNDSLAPGFIFSKFRGTLSSGANVQSGDSVLRLDARVIAGNTSKLISQIISNYVGDGNTQFGDIRFNVSSGGDPVEKVRINSIGTGFGVNPTAIIDLQSGTTTVAPMKFKNGSLLSIPQIGAVEFSGSSWYGTPTGGTRKTFAFLESPKFTGVVQLPSGTLLNNLNLVNYILNTGGTNNFTLVKTTKFNTYTGSTNTRITNVENDITYISGVTDTKLNITTFNTYTGSTIPWTKVSKVGSSLADLQTRNAVDLNVTVPDWSVTNVDDYIQKSAKYIEDTQGSGRLTPENPLAGNLTPILRVSGGTGYINYSGFHKLISWSAQTFNFSGFTEGTYYVYVDTNGVVQISTTEPSGIQQIKLGVLYFGGTFIGALNSTGSIVDNTTTRLFDYLTRLGLFIYDNGGLVSVYSGNSLGIVSSQLKVQNGLLSEQNSEISSANAVSGKFNHYYNTADQGWVNNYYFNIGKTGIIPVNRWNDITKNSNVVLTAFTVTFTQGSKVVTSPSDLTPYITTDDFIYKTTDTHQFMNPVSAITWTGSQTNINLETVYLGAGGSGTVTVDHALPHLGKSYAKNLILRTPDDQMVLILAQTKYTGDTAAKIGVLPATPPSLTSYIMKMAYLVVYSGTTNLAGHIFDIRPLPFSQVQGGQQGSGNVITVHGQLSGLGADDHLQYLRTDGTRALTGIQKYATQPTFTTDLDLISKKYVDDADNTKLSISAFTGYTGITAPATYLKITNFNSYSASTLTNINTRLLKTTFNTYTGTTLPATYQPLITFKNNSVVVNTGTTKFSTLNFTSGITVTNNGNSSEIKVIYGSEVFTTGRTSTQTTTSSTFADYLAHSFTLAGGTYKIEYACKINNNTANTNAGVQLLVNGTSLESGTNNLYRITTASHRIQFSSFGVRTLSAGGNSFRLQISTSAGTLTAEYGQILVTRIS